VSKVSPHSLELEWRPPLGDGGSPVLGYVVEMTESGSGGQWVKVGKSNSFLFVHHVSKKLATFFLIAACPILIIGMQHHEET